MAGNLANFGAQNKIPLTSRRLQAYTAGFLLSFLLYCAVHGIGQWRALPVLAISALAVGFGAGYRRWLRVGVTFAIFFAFLFPVVADAVMRGEPLADVVAKVPVWPQLLVFLIGSRVLAAESELSFAEFWRQPMRQRTAVALQSFSAAVALGSFLTLTFYLAVPHLTQSGKQSQPILISAMLGGTMIHSMIIFLFFIILSLILDAALAYARDRSVLAAFRRWIEAEKANDGARDPQLFVAEKTRSGEYSRALQLIYVAIKRAENQPGGFQDLSTLALDGFHQASRQFVRTLLPFLPLLGFLGTVVGLATAIGELPRNIADQAVRSFDVSASLAGLAIKFETTLLGLIASMVSSFSLNLLEKYEFELAAECMLAAGAAVGDHA